MSGGAKVVVPCAKVVVSLQLMSGHAKMVASCAKVVVSL